MYLEVRVVKEVSNIAKHGKVMCKGPLCSQAETISEKLSEFFVFTYGLPCFTCLDCLRSIDRL
jgi:hypothetical protein